MKEVSTFSPHDGHIESVVIGVEQVKVSFQTWNCLELVLVFDNVVDVKSHCLSTDIDDFFIQEITIETEERMEMSFFQYAFLSVWDKAPILCISAKSMKIYEVGSAQNDNAALLDVGLDYLGRQVPRQLTF